MEYEIVLKDESIIVKGKKKKKILKEDSNLEEDMDFVPDSQASMEVISQPHDVGKSSKGNSGPNHKDYETCSEEKAPKKSIKTKLVAPSNILKDRIAFSRYVSSSSPILQTKRKQGPKEGNNKKMATRSAS